ncbi:PH domain-containing protein [Microbacterium enclense]|uniref:PH domain-containing protein n=1 Tax=Microbacterium enclense TaxID=993073 RepID=UPI003F7F2CA2
MTTPPETPRPDPFRPDDDADAPPAERLDAPAHHGPSESAAPGPGDDAVLGERTYDRILEPRSRRRLPLGDGTWYQLARAYVRVQLITQGAVVVLVLAAAIVAQVITGVCWQWIPAGIILLVTLVGLVITPRQARSFGYQLRRDDLVFRRGILWQRVVAVPYGRMQLVDITHGPLDRGFGIAQLKLVTAAASTGVTIPGLTQEAAEHLRDTLVAVAETRRTGL